MKNTFVLYKDLITKLSSLENEDMGILFQMILCYENGAEYTGDFSYAAGIAFDFIKEQLDHFDAEYEEKVQQRKEAASSRWNNKKDAKPMRGDAKPMRDDARTMRDDASVCETMREPCEAMREDALTLTLTPTLTDKKNIGVINNSSSETNEVSDLAAEWNSLVPYGIKPVSKLTCGSKRYQSAKARINQYGYPAVKKAVENIRGSDFLQGKNSRGWVITFDWFVLPNNFPKVLEGNYTNKQANTQDEWLEKWAADDG